MLVSSMKNQTRISWLRKIGLSIFSVMTLSISCWSQTSLEVRGKGNDVIVFPNGTASFADRVVDYQPGSPLPQEAHRNTDAALGVPDFRDDDFNSYVSLGKAGVLILEFVDNRLVDIPGYDLYVFEVGPDIENTYVEVSEDGINWIEVGRIQGSTAYIDIGPHTRPGQKFRFVKLSDDPTQGGHSGKTPGADIDAIGAIGSIAAPTSPSTPPPTPSVPSQNNGESFTYFNAVTYYDPGAGNITWNKTYPQRILGSPNATSGMEFGDSGAVVMMLSDHVAVTGDGHDLVIFGDLKGPINVEVSSDGANWTSIGRADIGRGIMDFGKADNVRYLRLTDLKDGKSGSTIEAVGAVRVRPLR